MTAPIEWLCAGSHCHASGPLLRASVASGFRLAQAIAPGRVLMERWIRYHVALGPTLAAPSDAQLIEVTDEIVEEIRRHPDHAADQVRSGLRFWDHGLRRAYLWRIDGQPACMQWLLTRDDNPQLRTLGEWAGMYVPLGAGCGQVENLYAFSTARRKGVATQFEYALFDTARAAGLTRLITHIHEGNVAARGWADRTGWREYGVITRYRLDLPGLRAGSMFVHEAQAPRPDLTKRTGEPPVPAGQWTR